MKYEITAEDRQIMEYDLKHDRTLKHLRNLTFYKFSPGDVLIREELGYALGTAEKQWKVETGSGDIPLKFVYVFENELGIGYIRRMSVSGDRLVERPMCVTEFDPDRTRFKLDPEYADHMLLAADGEEFDMSERYRAMKKRREAVHRRNKKKMVPLASSIDVINWMKTLKVGDQVWIGYSIGGIPKDPYVIKEVHFSTSGIKQPANTWGYIPEQDYIVTVGTGSNAPYNSTFYASNLTRYYVTMERPEYADEMIE